MLTDWDKIFAWKVWQFCKWITGILIIIFIIYTLYKGGDLQWEELRMLFTWNWKIN